MRERLIDRAPIALRSRALRVGARLRPIRVARRESAGNSIAGQSSFHVPFALMAYSRRWWSRGDRSFTYRPCFVSLYNIVIWGFRVVSLQQKLQIVVGYEWGNGSRLTGSRDTHRLPRFHSVFNVLSGGIKIRFVLSDVISWSRENSIVICVFANEINVIRERSEASFHWRIVYKTVTVK